MLPRDWLAYLSDLVLDISTSRPEKIIFEDTRPRHDILNQAGSTAGDQWDYYSSVKHHRSTADASQSSSRASTMDHQTIGDIITSNTSPLFSLHEHVENIVWDILNLGVARWMLADCSAIYRRWFLASKHLKKISMNALKFSRCPNALAKHGDYSRTSPINRRTTGAWWRCTSLRYVIFHNEHIFRYLKMEIAWTSNEGKIETNNSAAQFDVYRHQNMASIDVRFRRLKSIPALEVDIIIMAVDP